MPHEPKRRHSTERKGERRASIKLTLQKGVLCANCGNPTISHAICKKCGFYKGRQVLAIKTKKVENPATPPVGGQAK